jgi:hypothetical protein
MYSCALRNPTIGESRRPILSTCEYVTAHWAINSHARTHHIHTNVRNRMLVQHKVKCTHLKFKAVSTLHCHCTALHCTALQASGGSGTTHAHLDVAEQPARDVLNGNRAAPANVRVRVHQRHVRWIDLGQAIQNVLGLMVGGGGWWWWW